MISPTANANALHLAKATGATFSGAGVYAIEMFLLPDDTVLVRGKKEEKKEKEILNLALQQLLAGK